MEKKPNTNLHFPPGFRFHPSDEELIIHYLQNKVTSRPLPASVIAEIDLYKYNPWELPMRALFGEDEWFFFSPRDRKYPNGERPNRAAASGYWKATGTDRPILTSSESKNIGVKKALVFYKGRPPKGVKTEWTMNEYRLLDRVIKPPRLKGCMRLDDWVLCRVRRKGNTSKNTLQVQEGNDTRLVRSMQPASTHGRADMITDYLNQDCQVLALILAGQGSPPMETNSTATFHGSNNIISFVKEDSEKRQDGFPPMNIFPSTAQSQDEYPSDSLLSFPEPDQSVLPWHIYAGCHEALDKGS